MIVNGLKLPVRLIELLEAGRWQRPADTSVLAAMTGAEQPHEFKFASLDGMIRETAAGLKLMKNGLGHLYNLTSLSAADRASHPDALIVEQSVLIGINWDEETICLDYRDSLDEPTVVCSVWLNSQGKVQWEVIAPTFAAFADQLGL